MPGADLTSPYALFKVLDALFLQSHLGYRLAPDAALSLERLAPSIDLELMEEIRPRLDRLFTSRDSHAAVTGLDRLHLLTALFPELVPAQELRQDKDFHPEGTVYEHTLECFRFIESPSLHLFLALLLHDVGKPSTATLDKNLRYPGHSRAGVALARRMLRRLGYDEPLIEKVAFHIRYHLVAHEMRRMSAPRQRELMEDELFPDLLRLYKADIRSCYGDLEQYYRVLAMAKEVRRD